MSDQTKLPKSWKVVPLPSAASINPPKRKIEATESQLAHFVPMACVQEEFSGIDVSTTRPLREVLKGYTFFQEGDVLFAKITPCMENGKLAVVPALEHRWGFGSTEFHVLRATEIALPKWIAHFVSQASVRRDAKRSMTGSAGQLRVTALWLNEQELPIPPLAEQARIIAKIEELFSDLDAGVAALKRAKANLKRYRAAVLKAAVEGKLTEEWQHDSFTNANWVEIGTLLTSVEQGWSPKCERAPSSSDDEWAVMKTSAVLPMQFLAHENKRLPIRLAPETQFEVKSGDLLITRARPRNRAAVTCLVRSSRPRLIVCDKVYRIRCDNLKVMPAYLEVVLNSPPLLDELDEMKTGISDSGVNLTQQKFRRLKIPVPPLQSQRRIVDDVEDRLSVATVAESEIDNSLARSSRLRQSILKQAFEGKLVPQDPTDEPASVLLERLRASRSVHERNGKAATPARTRGRRAKPQLLEGRADQ